MFKLLFLGILTYAGLFSVLDGKARAQEAGDFANRDPYMNNLYIKGGYLIYDCSSGHWVCSRREEFERCQRWRELALSMKNENLRCAPFIEFKNMNECHEKQIEMTNRGSEHGFCLHPEVRKDQVGY